MTKRKTIPLGHCYEWAYHGIMVDEAGQGVLVHGTVAEPFASPPHRYKHAWIERDGMVYDWQTMEGGCGGRFAGIGYPAEVFYELFQPTRMTKYTKSEAMGAMLRDAALSGAACYGPWKV